MFRQPILTTLTVLIITATANQASALSYAYVPEAIRLMTAEYVVVGTMGNVNQVGRDITGTLTITEVLKGKPAGKTVEMAWADLSQFGGGRGHQNGQTGVWLLSKGRNGKYATGYPGNFLPANQTKRVKQSLKDIENMNWVKADGLAVAYVLETQNARGARVPAGQPNPTARLVIYPVVRNVSDKPLHVCAFTPDKPFAIKMKTPTGSKVTGNLYPRPNNQKIHQRFFHKLEPGQTKALTYGLSLYLNEIGVYQVDMSFKSTRDGAEFKLDNVWTGELKSTTRKVTTPGHKG